MAIEGPLRELGIHDVFQMLDLSRKTGALRVTSAQRDNEGTVLFDRGKVISASIRSSPTPLGTMLLRAGRITEPDLTRARAQQETGGDRRRLGEILLALGAISARELERQVRLQIEAVVFELMSWRDGFFSFEDRDVGSVQLEASVQVSTESLLMEGARRIDEWSRIADKVPNLGVVPVLATVDDQGHAPQLDLLPNEWEVLAIIDGVNDLRGIAATLGRSEFDVAKVVYGLVTTGVIDLRAVATPAAATTAVTNGDPRAYLEAARASLVAGRAEEALSAARSAIGAAPTNAEARLTAARALRRLRRVAEASDELRRAAELDPGHPDIQLELGYAAVCQGDLRTAVERWEQFLRAAPGNIAADEVREALTSAARLSEFLEMYAGV
jgi:tetratricopeptide (TPR) repeat protein